MTEKHNHPSRSPPVANYSSALAKAVEWLGNRYLLAIPIKAALRSGVDLPALGSNPDPATIRREIALSLEIASFTPLGRDLTGNDEDHSP